jgi:stalled ribosome rescue protein Dom34
MKDNLGLWIDHRCAVIVGLSGTSAEVSYVASDVGRHVRYSGSPHGKAEDQRDRRHTDDLHRYYDRVIATIRHARSILVLGPGEAKGELAERLRQQGFGDRLAATEPADKMTERQVVARVKAYFSRQGAVPTEA